MPRCDYDELFHRVFCITMLAIAFTFTVILTNVFIDINGLHSGKMNHQNIPAALPIEQISYNEEDKLNNEERPFVNENRDFFEKLGSNEGDTEVSSFRTKRSLDSSKFKFQIKNPTMRKVLTNHLETLLQELDAEESDINKIDTPKTAAGVQEKKTIKEQYVEIDNRDTNEVVEKKNEEILHLAMHNVLLQGIIGHMDLSDVYKKVHALVKNFDRDDKRPDGKEKDIVKHERMIPQSNGPNEDFHNVKGKLLQVMLKCDDFQKEPEEKNGGIPDKIVTKQVNGRETLIKTIIDITSVSNGKIKENVTNSHDTVKGVIKLIYNGKSINFDRMGDSTQNLERDQIVTTPQNNPEDTLNIDKGLKENNYDNENELVKAMADYFNKFYKQTLSKRRNIMAKRLKRHVKVRNHHTTTQKPKKRNKKDEEQLYVEIETHFNSKGVNGEKKKKLIRGIVDKIEKAIHADLETLQDTKKKDKHLHVKKRVQDTLGKDTMLVKKLSIPLDKVIHRQIDPISKIVPVEENTPNISDKSGEKWKYPYFGPHFLTSSKAINSGEMGEVKLEYNTDDTGIPQRIQQPLNSEEGVFDLGNLNFVIKDIEGTGFSIGFNQYLGEAPDSESVKVFTSLNDLIKTHNRNENMTATTELTYLDESVIDKVEETVERSHELQKRDVSNKSKRQISNEYNIAFNNNFLPYDSYHEIFEDRNKKVSISIKKNDKNISYNLGNINIKPERTQHELPFFIDEQFLERELRPSEILGLANLMERKKRSTDMKKITNMKRKGLPLYIKGSSITNRKIFINKRKRNKRQVNKIRIIATDNIHRHSDENIYLVSDEHMFADRALVRDTPHSIDKVEPSDYKLPSVYEESKPSTYLTNIFGSRSRHNSLMSKYPHVFMEEISRSKEETPHKDHPFFLRQIGSKLPQEIESFGRDNFEMKPESFGESTNFQDVVETIEPPASNYKLTLKILPKNESENSGFKEVHTSINKSMSKNGMLYSSLVNMSEVSKVENVNKTNQQDKEPSNKITETKASPLMKHIKEQQLKMKMLLKQHKLKIDEELEHLKNERQKLDKIMLEKVDKKSNEVVDVVSSNFPQFLHLNKDDATLLTSALMKLKDYHNLTTINPQFTTITTPTTVMSTQNTVTTTNDPLKIEIIETMQRNENLTHKLLTKIDKNTELLQIFLQKLTDKFEIVKASGRKAELEHAESAYPKNPSFVNDISKIPVDGNGTHFSGQFLYNYQHSPNVVENKLIGHPYEGHSNGKLNDINRNRNVFNTDNKVQHNFVRRDLGQRDLAGNQTKFF